MFPLSITKLPIWSFLNPLFPQHAHHCDFFLNTVAPSLVIILYPGQPNNYFRMPAIAHLQPRFSLGSSGGVSGSGIAIIVVVGFIPAVALIWVVVWLLFFYGHNRTCCCTRRKRRAAEPEMLESGSTDTSQDIRNEKAVYHLPQRPFSAHARNYSGSSAGRFSRSDANRPVTTVSTIDARMSMQSSASASTVPVVHEPKPFV